MQGLVLLARRSWEDTWQPMFEAHGKVQTSLYATCLQTAQLCWSSDKPVGLPGNFLMLNGPKSTLGGMQVPAAAGRCMSKGMNKLPEPGLRACRLQT